MNYTPFEATIAKVTQLTADTISIAFEQPEGAPLSYYPGQYLTLIADVNANEVRRAYSLCSSTYANELPTVAVKAVPNGVLSTYLLAQAKAGSKLRLLAPMGHFMLEVQPLKARHIVLIGAGSGITPLYSILKAVLLAEPNSLVTLIYGNRTEDSIIFGQELNDWQQKYPARLKVINCLSKAPETWYGPKGRLDAELLAELLEQSAPVISVSETHYYLCGPDGLMETATAELKKAGVKPFQIHKESFFHAVDEAAREAALAAAAAAVTSAHDDPGQGREVLIKFEGDEYTVLVKPEDTILSAALDQDIPLPYSCQAGLCTACRARCMDGKVHMDEMEGLSQSEADDGYVLCCVAHPLTKGVVIDYNA
jgi:ring-1,2-phenylacetyl-CoA epoxidase subunit PaaE